MSRNPDWTRDELILALELFMIAGRKQLDSSDQRVVDLSDLLNRLPLRLGEPRKADFRNANGVSMKLGNFLRVDPAYSGKGLSRGNKLEQEVWDEFGSDLYRLRSVAAHLRNSVLYVAEERKPFQSDVEPEQFAEGSILTRLHKAKERNRRVVQKKKRSVLEATGRLECEACGFDFRRTYGLLGGNFAECHHTVPVSQLEPNHMTRVSDLAIVCANCHRMIHKSRPMLSVGGLRTIIQTEVDGSSREHSIGGV